MTGLTVLDDAETAFTPPCSTTPAPTTPAPTTPAPGKAAVPGEFRVASPEVSLGAHGVAARLDVPTWDGPAVAQAARDLLAQAAQARWAGEPAPILVGAIPFDASRPAHLVVPERQSWEDGPGTVPTGDGLAPAT